MLVTLLGTTTLARLMQSEKAKLPMLVTDRPLMVVGMVTAPPGPVYPVMVIVPLLVVKVNWACTTTGSASSSSRGSSTLNHVFIPYSGFREKATRALSPRLPFYAFSAGCREECSKKRRQAGG